MAGKSVDREIEYEEFEPYCKWQRKEDRDVLEIHLQDFKREQLKVQISNHGVLKISGERQIDSISLKEPSTKRAKFYKEVAAPNTKYDTHAIHAKFANNNLIITLPKTKLPSPPPDSSSSQPSNIDQTPKSGCAAAAAGAREEAPPHHLGGTVPTTTAQCQLQSSCRKRPLMGSKLAKMVASLAATAVAVVVLAAYVHFMYKSTVDRD